MSCVSHAEPPNVSYDEKVKIENDGEFYTVTINFSVSYHTIDTIISRSNIELGTYLPLCLYNIRHVSSLLLTQGDTESVCTYTLVLNKSSSFESYYQFENGTVIFKIPVDRVEPNTEYEVYFEISNAAGSNATHTTTFSNYY